MLDTRQSIFFLSLSFLTGTSLGVTLFFLFRKKFFPEASEIKKVKSEEEMRTLASTKNSVESVGTQTIFSGSFVPRFTKDSEMQTEKEREEKKAAVAARPFLRRNTPTPKRQSSEKNVQAENAACHTVGTQTNPTETDFSDYDEVTRGCFSNT